MSIEQLAIKVMWSLIIVIAVSSFQDWLLTARIIELSKKLDLLLARELAPKGDS